MVRMNMSPSLSDEDSPSEMLLTTYRTIRQCNPRNKTKFYLRENHKSHITLAPFEDTFQGKGFFLWQMKQQEAERIKSEKIFALNVCYLDNSARVSITENNLGRQGMQNKLVLKCKINLFRKQQWKRLAGILTFIEQDNIKIAFRKH